MIKDEIKPEEYREIKPYWIQRLTWHEYHGMPPEHIIKLASSGVDVFRRNIDQVSANNGYAKGCPNIKWEHKGIRIGQGNPEWGAEPGKDYFILDIGNIIK